MKSSTTKKLFAFIIAIMMFSALPQLTYGQNKNDKHSCPKGYYQVCYTDPWSGARRCYCFPLGSSSNANTNNTSANALLSISGSDVPAISFQLMESQKISLKIYDATGRLVKTLADKIFDQGEHQLQWDAARDYAGIYIVQFNSSTYSETKKIYVIN